MSPVSSQVSIAQTVVLMRSGIVVGPDVTLADLGDPLDRARPVAVP